MKKPRARRFLWLGYALAACASEAPPSETGPAAKNRDAATNNSSDAGAASSSVDATSATPVVEGGLDASAGSLLPVSYTRPDVGTPLTAAELAAATDELVAILKDTNAYAFLEERLHGWPETHPQGGFWWGSWWSGITVTKSGGTVTYKHSNDGADNNGLRTAPYLEGMCYAHALSGDARTAHLVRKMVRGFSAWILSMVKDAADTNPALLNRTFYTASYESNDSGKKLFVDTSLNRPGIDAETSYYVRLPSNPTFGDIWIKNRRSKDDIGHMLRALTQLDACSAQLDAATKADIAQAKTLYEGWAKEVDARGFVIPTLEPSLALVSPSVGLARYEMNFDLECPNGLAVRLFHAGVSGGIDCKSGISAAERVGLPLLKNDARQILRSHQSAAVALSWRKNQLAPGLALLTGLGERVDIDYGYATSATPPNGFDKNDAAGFFAYAAAVGVPLTSREVRWLHERLHQAYAGMRAPASATTFKLWDPSVPDGLYSYDPPNPGLYYADLGLLMGTCAAPHRNPTARPLLDCARLVQALKAL